MTPKRQHLSIDGATSGSGFSKRRGSAHRDATVAVAAEAPTEMQRSALRIPAAARALCVSSATVRNCVKLGKIEFIRNPGGRAFIPQSSIEKFYNGEYGGGVVKMTAENFNQSEARRKYFNERLDAMLS